MKNGYIRMNFGFRGAESHMGVMILNFFFQIFWEVSEQYDQVSQKPDF